MVYKSNEYKYVSVSSLCNHIHETVQNTDLSLHNLHEQVISGSEVNFPILSHG